MAKANIIISGQGVTAVLGSTNIEDINTLSFSIFGERSDIDLTTIDATKYKMKLLGDLQKIPDITVNKKSAPVDDAALYSVSSELLTITYKQGQSDDYTAKFYAQLKNVSNSEVERAPGDGVNVDLVFYITNLNNLVETAPAVSVVP